MVKKNTLANKSPLLTGIILLTAMSNLAYPAEDISDLKKYITDFVVQNSPIGHDEEIKVDVLNLDPNFKLPYCKNKIQLHFAKKEIPTQNNTIKMSCESAPNWHIYVPIYVHVYAPVLAAKHYMPSGTKITENDVYLTKHDKKLLREGYYTEPNEILGLSTLHAVPSGVAFTPKNVKQRTLVKRNHTIKLILNQGGVKIEMMGVAKSDGILNETIKVMNPSSKKIVHAVVTGLDRVEIITS